MLNKIIDNPLFITTFILMVYVFSVWLNKKTKLTIINPLLITTIILISTLLILKIPYEKISSGAEFIKMFISPATTSLAVIIYKNFSIVKRNFLPILIGCTAGAVTSISSISFLCRIFSISEKIYISLLPKSITLAIGLETSQQIGGIPSITAVATFFTGLFVAIIGPSLIKLLNIKSKIASGIALGTSGHGLGTAKALQSSELEGALSSISICFCGIATVIMLAF